MAVLMFTSFSRFHRRFGFLMDLERSQIGQKETSIYIQIQMSFMLRRLYYLTNGALQSNEERNERAEQCVKANY